MCSQKKVCNFFIGVVMGSMMLSMGAMANPPGVPVGEAPLSCTTVNSRGGGDNYLVEAITGTNGEYPLIVDCPNEPGKKCSDYGYKVTQIGGETISQSLFAISADLELDSADPAPANIGELGDGDSLTGFLQYTRHEYPIRFNAKGDTIKAHIFIKNTSAPRIGTAYIRGGKIDESCLIAGPGVPGNPWVPTTSTETVVAVGGKCEATLHYSGNGKLINISLPVGSTCYAGKVPDGAVAAIGGEPIQNVNGIANGRDVPVTFGTGTTTVYLPSGWAICTSSPCPGATSYVWW